MNQVQRKFIIERIQTKVKEKISQLEKERLGYPSASNYYFKAIMLELQDNDKTATILAGIKKKALQGVEGSNWLSEERMGCNKETTIRLDLKVLLKSPDDYIDEVIRVTKHNNAINEEIAALKLQLDSIEVRVQLASDKTLANMINEVDDMGDLSLIDTKIKLLN
jgi:hypothetical protein